MIQIYLKFIASLVPFGQPRYSFFTPPPDIKQTSQKIRGTIISTYLYFLSFKRRISEKTLIISKLRPRGGFNLHVRTLSSNVLLMNPSITQIVS